MDYLTDLVKPKEQAEFADIWKRQDDDRLLYDLDKYVMKQLDGQDMPNVNSVTLPAPKNFADKVISVVSGAVSQIVVEGEDLEDKQAVSIENCLTDVFAAANERISDLEYPDLQTFSGAMFTLRGKGGLRILLRYDANSELIPDIVPLDPRYYSYDVGLNGSRWGLDWFCPILRRSRAKILADYVAKLDDKKDIAAIVRDFWNSKENVIYVNDKPVAQKKNGKKAGGNNPYGYPPFVTQGCNSGSFLMDKESMVRHFESIYGPLRTMFPELNRIASILSTQALAAIKLGLQKQVPDEGTAQRPTLEQVPGVAKIVPVTKGYEYLPMPTADVNNATQTYWSIIKSYVEQSSLSQTEWGNVTFPLPAVAIKALSAKNDTVYLPRIQGMAMLYQKAARMIIKQLIMWGKPITLSVGGLRKTYQPSDLEGEYKIGFKFYSISPEEEIANWSVAGAAKSLGMSQISIFTDIVKLKDPEGEMRKRASEDAEGFDPAIKLYRQGHRLIDSEDYVEAELTLQSLERLLRQRAMPPPPLPPPNPELPQPTTEGKLINATESLVPLLGKGGGRAKVPAEKLQGS